ncbi:MAG TPA: hypothetical protein VIG24_03385 [Acidimicrobiia bacterium]
MTMLVAQMSIATGIAPNDLLDAPPEVFRAMVKVLSDRNKERQKAARRRG